MARRQVAPARKSSRNQPRQAPYALPYRTPPVAPGGPQLKPRYAYQQVPLRHDVGRSTCLAPETSYSSSDGPPTPDSTLTSPKTSPYLTHATPASSTNCYRDPFSDATPCTDSISGFAYVDRVHQSLDPFGYPSPEFTSWQDQPQSLNILTPTESTCSSLAGIQTSPETDSFVHLVEFPNGPTPTRLQSFPQTQDPWAPYSLRQDDLMILDTDSSPSSLTSALSPASSAGRARRVGPLSQDQRRNANKVRDVGACIRCSCMKERCDEKPECSNCQNKKTRKWKLGCVRQKLNDRANLLFPAPIEDRYDMKHTNRYVDGTAFFYLHDRPSFVLSLEMGLGGPLFKIPVKEIEPVEHKRILQSFLVNSTNRTLDTTDSWDPPIVPYLSDQNGLHNQDGYVKDLLTQLAMSMRSVFERKHSDGYYWPWRCFEAMSCFWVGEVVEKIHEFHHNAPNIAYFQPIRTAHCVLYFNYMLDHQLLVKDPKEAHSLFSNLASQPNQIEREKNISPETVQRFIKAIIFPELKKRTTELLAKLHETLLAMATAKAKDQPAGASLAQRDLVFSLSFMLLVIIGQTQARLLMLSELSASEKGINLPLHEAESHINEVEHSLANYIISFHEFAANKRPRPRNPVTPISPPNLSSKPEEEYSAKFGLLRQVEELTRNYRTSNYFPRHDYLHQVPQRSFCHTCHLSSKLPFSPMHIQGKPSKPVEDVRGFPDDPYFPNTLFDQNVKLEDPLTETPWCAFPDSDRPRTFERGKLDNKEFDKDNIHRLCWKFVETVFQSGA